MATIAQRLPWRIRARAALAARPRAVPACALVGLLALSLLIRTRELGVGFWIDEGLSVGIASRDVLDIPGVLRQDGSPPLYYVLLHGWMQLFGRSEEATHALSVVLALLTVPVALWAARSLFGARAGWIAAGLAALNPFLTTYAQETRMYAVVGLLTIVSTAAWVHVFAFDRPRYAPLLAVSLAALLYTHNWALYYATAAGGAWLALLVLEPAERQRRLRPGLVAFGGALALYAPWIPSLLYQVAHTGAPWSSVPNVAAFIEIPSRLAGGQAAEMIFLLVAGAGIVALLRTPAARRAPEGRAAAGLLALFAGTMLLAWISSQVSPAWAFRYYAIGLGPLLLAGALGFARARPQFAAAGLALLAAVWLQHSAPDAKSNVREVMDDVEHLVRPGDLVVVTQPELVSVVNYYLPSGLQYATLTGRVADVGVTDWVDGVERLQAANVEEGLEPLVDALPTGRRVLLVTPMFIDEGRWTAPWTSLVREKTFRWRAALAADERLTVTALSPGSYPVVPHPVRATLFQKNGVR